MSAHKGVGGEAEGGQGLHSKSRVESGDEVIGLYWLFYSKTIQKTFCQLHESMYPFTTDSCEARSFTRSNTAI